MARKRLLTVEGAILIHLLDYLKYPPESDVPMEMTQSGMSRALGVRRSHISTSLDSAKARGTVEEHLSRVKGEKRKRKCYSLTPAGLDGAGGARSRVLEARVDATLPGSEGFSGTINELLGAMEEPPNLARLALLCYDGHVTVPADTGSATEILIPASIPLTGDLLGRADELELFERLFSGHIRVLALTGMPGIGKTWLAAHAASEFGAGNAFWYTVNEWSSPRNLATHLADFLAKRGHERLRRYLETHEVPDPADVHDILLGVPLEFVMVLDDCQNSGHSMASFLDMLASACTHSRNIGISLVGRHIPDPIGKRLSLDTGPALIELGPLDENSSLKLLAARGMPEHRASKIARRGGGHPLYLSLTGAESGPPETRDMEKMLAAEVLAMLSDHENDIMRLLSVFRTPVNSDALVESREDMESLERLKKRCLVTDLGGWSMHGLLRDFYYARQTPGEREGRHDRAAEYYNRHPGTFQGSIEEIHHLFMARDTESAILALAASGSQMLARGYVDELLGMLDMAPKDWQDRDDRLAMVLLRATAMDLLGNWEDAVADYEACQAIARKLGDGDREAAILRRLGAIRYRRGDLAGAREYMETAMGMTESPKLVAELQGSLGVILWKLGDTVSAKKAHLEDLEISEGENDPAGIARALNNLGILDWQLGNHADAMERYARALKHAEKISDKKLVAILYSNMGDVQRTLGNAVEARRYYERCLELAEDLKFNWQVAEAYRGLAEIIPDKRADYLSRALTIFERLGAVGDAKTVREMMP